MANVILDLGILVLFSFLLRMIFFATPTGPDSDDVNHLWRTRQIRRKRSFLKDFEAGDSVTEGYHASPPLPSLIVSFFPERHWLLAGKLLNISYDCLAVILAYLFSAYLFGEYLYSGNPRIPAFYSALIFSTMPVFFAITGSRLTSFGGRTLGLFFNMLFFICLGQAFIFNNVAFYIPTLLLGILIILTSQFGLQNMVFVSIILSVLYMDPAPLLVAVTVLVAGYFFPFVGVSKIARHKLNHFSWYRRNWKNYPVIYNRNNIKEILRLPVYLTKRPGYFLLYCLKFFTPTILFLLVPALFVLIGLYIQDPGFYKIIISGVWIKYFCFIIIADLVIFVLTSFRKLLFLGEAERYPGYSAFYISFIIVFYMAAKGMDMHRAGYLVLWQLCIVLLNFILFNSEAVREKLTLALRAPEAELVQFMNENLREKKIMSIPTKFTYWLAFHATGGNKFYYDFISSKASGLKYMNEDYIYYGYPKTDLEYFYKKYSIDAVVVAKKYFTRFCRDNNITYSFESLDEIFQNSEYSVYKRRGR